MLMYSRIRYISINNLNSNWRKINLKFIEKSQNCCLKVYMAYIINVHNIITIYILFELNINFIN